MRVYELWPTEIIKEDPVVFVLLGCRYLFGWFMGYFSVRSNFFVPRIPDVTGCTPKL